MRTMKTKIMMLFAALCVAMSVSAQSGEQAYMKGLALFNKQDYKSAVKYFEKSAEQGSVDGMFMLGCCHYEGLGISKNQQKGYYWYEQAAKHGDKTSQITLGKRYMEGKDVAKDLQKAIYWYEKAANQEDEEAKKILAELKTKNARPQVNRLKLLPRKTKLPQ